MSDVIYDVAIVGGGLAGLSAALASANTGASTVLLEASEEVGGKLRTDVDFEGFRFDHGFQVCFTSYEEFRRVARAINFQFSDCVYFGAGAEIVGKGIIGRSRPVKSLLSSAMSPGDLLLLLRLNKVSKEWEHSAIDTSVASFLADFGFTSKALRNFFVPFYGGISLDRNLQSSARQFLQTWFYLSTGNTCTFRKGIAEFPQCLRAHLETHSPSEQSVVRVQEPVSAIAESNGHFLLTAKTNVGARSVILAAGPQVANTILGTSIESQYKQSICLYFTSDRPVSWRNLIILNPAEHALVNQLVPLGPDYAPFPKFLCSATIIGERPESDEELAQMAINEMNTWGMNLPSLEFKRAYRIKEAQLLQEPGFEDRVPSIETHLPGVFLAGEMTISSSINDALKSGRLAAEAALAYLKNK